MEEPSRRFEQAAGEHLFRKLEEIGLQLGFGHVEFLQHSGDDRRQRTFSLKQFEETAADRIETEVGSRFKIQEDGFPSL